MGADEIHSRRHGSLDLPKTVSCHGDMIRVKMPVRAPMLNKLRSPVYYTGGNGELWENHATLQRTTEDLLRRWLRGGSCRDLKMCDGLRGVRRKATRRRVGRSGSRRGRVLEKLVDLLQGVRGRRGTTAKDR